MLISIFSLLGVALQVAAQAPGDHFQFCRNGTTTNSARHVFPEEWEILVDSYDYLNLFEGNNAPWRSTSQDSDSDQVGVQAEEISMCTNSLY